MNPFTAAIKIKPDFSIRLFLFQGLIALAAMIVIVSLPIYLLIKVAAWLVILMWFVRTAREHCWHREGAIQTAILRTDETWLITIKGGEPVRAELFPGCLVQPWLTVLQFRMPDRSRKALILLQDNIDVDTFRRLRVRLKNTA